MKKVQLLTNKTEKVFPQINFDNIIHDNQVLSKAVEDWSLKLLNDIYPVGKLFITTDDFFDPSIDLIPGSNWVKIKPGRILVGKGTFTDKDGVTKTFYNEIEDIGVYNTPCPPVPSHYHTFSSNQECDGGSSLIDYGTGSSNTKTQGYAGGDAPHTNVMACYAANIWRRLPDEIPTLEEASWEFISQMAQEGIAEYLWNIGDEKTIWRTISVTGSPAMNFPSAVLKIIDFKGQYTKDLTYDSDGLLITPKSQGITFAVTLNSAGGRSFENDYLQIPFTDSQMYQTLCDIEADQYSPMQDIIPYIRKVVKKRFYYNTSKTLVEESVPLTFWFPNSFELKLPSNQNPITVEHFSLTDPNDIGEIPTFDSYFYTKDYSITDETGETEPSCLNKIYHNMNSGQYEDPALTTVTLDIMFCVFI